MPHTARNHLRPIVSRRDPTRFDAWSSRGGRPEWTLGVWGSTRTRSTGALSAGRVRPSCPTRTCPAWRVRGRGAGGGVVCSGVGTHTVEPGACMVCMVRLQRLWFLCGRAMVAPNFPSAIFCRCNRTPQQRSRSNVVVLRLVTAFATATPQHPTRGTCNNEARPEKHRRFRSLPRPRHSLV